jgi:CheY-like chemotaxis protein
MRHHEVLELTFGQESGEDLLPAVAEHPAPSRVLLVEDDPAFSDFLAWSFTQHGYTVEKAANTREALSLLDRRGESAPFDLVLSDVAMPGGSGTDSRRSSKIRAASSCRNRSSSTRCFSACSTNCELVFWAHPRRIERAREGCRDLVRKRVGRRIADLAERHRRQAGLGGRRRRGDARPADARAA